MKTKFFVMSIALISAVGLSSCYTEFATTQDNGYGYQSYSPDYYYDSTYAGESYDSSGAPIINNYYNYYGYGNPYDSWWYDNWYTPSPWWWSSGLWLSFDWGLTPWYGGFGWPYYYYRTGFYGFSPYYSPYYYSPFYPYGPGYVYSPVLVNPTGRARTIGDTRYGRDSYGGGSEPVLYTPSAGSVTGTGSAGAGSAASASRQPASTERTRSTNASPSSSSTTTQQPRERTRTGETVPQPPQQATAPAPSSRPESQPSSPPPRVRSTGSSRSGDSGSGSDNSGSRSRGHGAYSGNYSSPHRAASWGGRFPYRVMRVEPRREMQYTQPVREPRFYEQPRVESRQEFTPSFRPWTPAVSVLRSEAPPAAREGGGSRTRR
jgi:hypothetical protein